MSSKEARVQNIPFEIAGGGSLALPGGHWDWIYVAELSAGAALLANGPGFNVPLVVGRRISRGDPITQSVLIENLGSGVASGVLFVGSGDVRDSTVVGTVSVVDGGEGRSSGGVAFSYYTYEAATVAQFGHKEIKNTSTSKSLVVNKICVQQESAANAYIALCIFDAELSGADANASFTNKLLGSAADAEVSVLSQLAGTVQPYTTIKNVNLEQYKYLEIQLSEPVVIPPGGRFGVMCLTANCKFSVTLEGYR